MTDPVVIERPKVTHIVSHGVQIPGASAPSGIVFSATDRVLGRQSVGAGPGEEIVCTPFARSLMDDADNTAARSTLGVVIGTNVQAWDQDLDGLAALAATGIVVRTGAGAFAGRQIQGTTDRITVSDGAGLSGHIGLDIAATYVGQTTIVTLGTITTGTWAASFPGGGSVNSTGEIGVRGAPNTDRSIHVRVPSSTGTSLHGVYVDITGPTTATNNLRGFLSVLQSTAASYTVATVDHFRANQTVLGAGSTITLVRGFYASTSIAVGGTNYGFYSDINDATTTFAFYGAGTAFSFFGGRVGIGSTSNTAASLQFGNAHLSTGTQIYTITASQTAPATATGAFYGYRSTSTTAAASFTLGELSHFYAAGSAAGAGSTITNARGFFADNALAVGTNNYGFYSNINNATATYQLYMGGTAQSYFNGPVGIFAATNPLTNGNLLQLGGGSTHPGTNTTIWSVYSDYLAPATATSSLRGFSSLLRTINSAVTFTQAVHYIALQTIANSPSTITTCYGFFASNNIAAGTANNYGFYSDMSLSGGAAANYHFYGTGTAQSYFGGQVGIGALPTLAYFSIGNAVHPNTGPTIYGMQLDISVPSTATSNFYNFRSVVRTAAAVFTVNQMIHFLAENTIIGGGSAISNVYGFYASDAISDGANNYGFYSDIADVAGHWQMNLAGTAPSGIRGRLMVAAGAIGDDPNSIFRVSGTHTSASASIQAMSTDMTFPDTATGTLYGHALLLRTANSAFTANNINFFCAQQMIRGAASTITTVRGFFASNSIATGTTNYGFYSDIGNAATTWQMYLAGTAKSTITGNLGLGSQQGIDDITLFVGVPTSGTSTTQRAIAVSATFPATVTVRGAGVRTSVATVAAAYTVSNLIHYHAEISTKGAGSTITLGIGFYAANGIAVASTNYGFHSDIAAGTNNYQIYMGGTAESYFGGTVGILQSGVTQAVLRVGNSAANHPSSATTLNGVSVDYIAPSTATVLASAFTGVVRTQATAFTVTEIRVFDANTVSKGAGSTITNVSGFQARNAIAVGTNNYGFWSDIALNGASTWQLYMAGTAPSFFGSSLQLLTAVGGDVDVILRVGNSTVHPSASATIYGINTSLAAPSTATGDLYGYRSTLSTVAAAFTLTNLRHYSAITSSKGAGSTITNVQGFYAANAIAVGTNNYGFYSDIAAATTTWQLYMAGTAPSFFARAINVIVSTTAQDVMVRVGAGSAHPDSAAVIVAFKCDLIAPSTATTHLIGYESTLQSAAASFTMTTGIVHFKATSSTQGAGSTITNVIGFWAANAIAVGSTNYGFYSSINSATNTYQLRIEGTALNFIKGGVILDTTAAPTVGANQIGIGATTATTVGAAGGASALPATPDGYWIINVAGTAKKVPYYAN